MQIETFLKGRPDIRALYTFKMMAGYLDSQPALWQNQGTPTGPIEINPDYAFWSWVDRLNTSCTLPLCPYYPTYNTIGSRVENVTAAIATAGQSGWGCPDANGPTNCSDDALRFGQSKTYATFDSFMEYAAALDPIFLFLHQFNEFTSPDEGWNANTNDDVEPASLWGSSDLEIVRSQVLSYRRTTASHRWQGN